MKNLFSNLLIACILIILSSIFLIFTYHDFFNGNDEIRSTLVSAEIANQGVVFPQYPNNTKYNTDVFLKNGFLINQNKISYPSGFIINSLILVPLLSLIPQYDYIYGAFTLLVYILCFVILLKIFVKLGISTLKATVGATVFSISNFYLSIYVSYFPDYILVLFVLLFVNLLIDYVKKGNNKDIYLLFLISSFLLAYKITMYPIFFTFYILFGIYLYIQKRSVLLIVKLFTVFLFLFMIFNFPQLYSTKIGPSYVELAGNQNTGQALQTEKLLSDNKNAQDKIFRISRIFLNDYLIPKERGKYLIHHVFEDIAFFGSNNIFVVFGILFGMVALFKTNKYLFITVSSIFLTSFILWGNMNIYGGSDTFHLRNSHIRYMLPIFILFYIIGYYYFVKISRYKYLFIAVILLILIKTFLGLRNDYPFSSYSLINEQGYFYDYSVEKKEILNLHLPSDSYILSAVYDDYDLSYTFKNYADLKRLSDKKNTIPILVSSVVSDNPQGVYLLLPRTDSRYNPYTPSDISKILNSLRSRYKLTKIYESKYKVIYRIA